MCLVCRSSRIIPTITVYAPDLSIKLREGRRVRNKAECEFVRLAEFRRHPVAPFRSSSGGKRANATKNAKGTIRQCLIPFVTLIQITHYDHLDKTDSNDACLADRRRILIPPLTPC